MIRKKKKKKKAVKEVTAVNKKFEEKSVEPIQVNDKPDVEDPNDKVVKPTVGGTNGLTVESRKTGMWNDTIKILKELKNEKIIKEITFNYKFPTVDTYGNKSKEIVIKITLDRETLDKINYDNLPRENLPIIAKKY